MNLIKHIGILFIILVSCKSTEPILEIQDDFSPRTSNVSGFTINGHNIDGDMLQLYVQYKGECKGHNFELKSNGMYLKSNPPKLHTYLIDNLKNDKSCDEIVNDTISFNISEAKYSSNSESNVVTLIVYGYKTPIKYEYK